MRPWSRLLLLLTAGVPVVACFDFGKYSFPEAPGGVGGTSAVGAAAGSGAGSGIGSGIGSGVGNLLPQAGAGSGDGVCEAPPCTDTRAPKAAGSLGALCQSRVECASNFCVDGVCCEGACGAACEACNVAGSEGYCQSIDVDDQCLVSQDCPVGGECLQYTSGSTGACSGRGSCNASQGCVATYVKIDTPCAEGTGKCDGSGRCLGTLKPLGEPCTAGAECTERFCAATADGSKVCCSQACDGVCQLCNANGQCDQAPPTDPLHCVPPTCPTDDVCRDYPASPTTANCASFGKCVGDEACAPDALRPASDCECGPTGCKLAQGKACATGAQCGTGFCNNGVCCNSACNGTCEQCQQATGVCGAIMGCECAAGQTTTCGQQFGSLGDCAPRQITCSGAGRWPVAQCSAQSAELCNNDNRDEDCDGNNRNGCTCLNGTLSDCTEQRRAQGVCARRSLTCANGQWPVAQCNATSQELCGNRLDDNCNGAVDENPPCAPVFNGNNCNFSNTACDELRCSQCGGCDACQAIVQCVRDDNPGCATANDPVCRNNGCQAVVDEGDIELFGENGDIPATKFATDFIRCACTR